MPVWFIGVGTSTYSTWKSFVAELEQCVVAFVNSYFNVKSPSLEFCLNGKAGRGIRQYQKEDIENLRIVYHLVKEKGMTLAGAKQALKKNKTGTIQTFEVIERLKNIREELVKMRKELDYVV